MLELSEKRKGKAEGTLRVDIMTVLAALENWEGADQLADIEEHDIEDVEYDSKTGSLIVKYERDFEDEE